jgi:hypothetical protein
MDWANTVEYIVFLSPCADFGLYQALGIGTGIFRLEKPPNPSGRYPRLMV